MQPHGFIRRQGKQLLELVDDQYQIGNAVIGQDAAHSAQQAALVFGQLAQQALRRVGGHAQQGGFQFFQRVGAGGHLGDEPVLRTGQPAAA